MLSRAGFPPAAILFLSYDHVFTSSPRRQGRRSLLVFQVRRQTPHAKCRHADIKSNSRHQLHGPHLPPSGPAPLSPPAHLKV